MKTFLLLLLAFISSEIHAQVLCVKCYNQNAVVVPGSNLILNGGFETSTCDIYHDSWPDTSFCPNSLSYHCDVANWTCTGGGVDTYADVVDAFFTTIIEGTKAVYFGSQFCNTCSTVTGDTSCITQTGCEAGGITSGYPYNTAAFGGTTGVSLEQAVSGLIPGNIYSLEFWSGGEWENNNFNYDGMFAVDAGFGKILLRDPPTQPPSSTGRRYVVVFMATSSSHTIKFTSWGHICWPCTELILDDVRLVATGNNPCNTGIDYPSQNMITLYPNPATNFLTVTTNTNNTSEIILYDITSKKLLQDKFNGTTVLNIADLSKGIYLYEIKNNSEAIDRGKIIKE